jgi:hypothetical protein
MFGWRVKDAVVGRVTDKMMDGRMDRWNPSRREKGKVQWTVWNGRTDTRELSVEGE